MQKRLIRSILVIAFALMFVSVSGDQVYATQYNDYGENSSPEYLYFIEGTGAYLLPDTDGDIFFNLGKWYRLSEGSWSMSDNFDGPWNGVMVDSVPRALVDLPPDFRTTRHLGLIPYRYVVSTDDQDDYRGYHYYSGEYYTDYERHGYRRRWHPRGKFWFFVAPDFHDNDRDDRHRRRRRRERY